MAAKKTKYTKTMAARQLGVSVYKLNQMIAAGVLPDKPTEDRVNALRRRITKAEERYKEQVIEAFEDRCLSVEYCIKFIETAVWTYDLMLPKDTTPAAFVWRTLYEHRMEEKHERTK